MLIHVEGLVMENEKRAREPPLGPMRCAILPGAILGAVWLGIMSLPSGFVCIIKEQITERRYIMASIGLCGECAIDKPRCKKRQRVGSCTAMKEGGLECGGVKRTGLPKVTRRRK